MEWLYKTWPWYLSGPLIALVMFSLLFLGKQFGISSNLRTICTIGGAGKFSEFFKFDWRKESWNLLVILGAVIGGFIASHLMSDGKVTIHPKVAQQLAQDYNISSAGEAYLPPELFAKEQLSSPFTLAVLLIGGFLVGFGARYAGGCTSGHAISGLSNFQLPSMIAVIGFFAGGLIMIYFIYPFIFGNS